MDQGLTTERNIGTKYPGAKQSEGPKKARNLKPACCLFNDVLYYKVCFSSIWQRVSASMQSKILWIVHHSHCVVALATCIHVFWGSSPWGSIGGRGVFVLMQISTMTSVSPESLTIPLIANFTLKTFCCLFHHSRPPNVFIFSHPNLFSNYKRWFHSFSIL